MDQCRNSDQIVLLAAQPTEFLLMLAILEQVSDCVQTRPALASHLMVYQSLKIWKLVRLLKENQKLWVEWERWWSNRQRILKSLYKGLMIIDTDFAPSLCLGLFFVRTVPGKTDFHSRHRGISVHHQIMCSTALNEDNGGIWGEPHYMRSSTHLQANQKSAQTYDQWWNPCRRVRIFTHVTWINAERHIQSRRVAWAFIREGGNVGDMKSVQHSVSLPVNFVRMMLVGAQGWINSIWRDDEFWPLRVRWGGSIRDKTQSCVGGWVARTCAHGQRFALSLRNAKTRRLRPHWCCKCYFCC